MTPRALLLLLSLLPLAACAGGAPRPSDEAPTIEPIPIPISDDAPRWIFDPDAVFPSDKYLAAVASGPTRAAAEKGAYAALAARIVADVRASQRSTTAQASVDERTSRAASLRSDVAIDSSAVLIAARIAETWTDPDAAERYAIAVMDRELAAESYRREWRTAAAAARAALARADEAEPPLGRLADLADAAEALTQGESLRAALDVVRHPFPAESLDPAPDLPSSSEIRARMAALRRSLGVALDAPASLPPGLEPIIADALVAAGVPVILSGAPSLLLRAEYADEAAPSYAGRESAVRWTLRLELTDPARSRALDALSLEGAATGPTPAAARAEAVRASRRALDGAIDAFLRRAFHDPDTNSTSER